MGKSKQKTKSDKIDLLRKQYDAFLEEAKRRKERNDNILQKLDKMRICDKLVPYTTKEQYLREPCITQPYHRYESLLEPTKEYQICQAQERSCIQNFAIPMQAIDKSILQEISKTYILIPKLRQADPVYLREQINHESQNMDDNDWKSKYDILNKLKQTEKEESNTGGRSQTSEATHKNNQSNDNYIFDGKHKGLKKVSINPQHSDLNQNVDNTDSSQESKYLENVTLKVTKEESLKNKNHDRDSESSITYSQVPLERNLQNIEVINNHQHLSNLNKSKNENEGLISFAPKTDAATANVFVQDSESEQMQASYNSAQYYDLEAHKSVNSKDNCKTELGQVDQVGVANDDQPNQHYDGHYSEGHDISVYRNQTNGSAKTHETNLINNNSDIRHSNESRENYVTPSEQNKNIEELKVIQSSHSEDAAVENQHQTEDFHNTKDKEHDNAYEENPQSNVFVEDTVNPDHDAAIEDFESEQTNMFYTQPDQQSEYGNGMEGNVHDQVQNSQDENYLQDEQYNAHYDAVLSDPAYAVEAKDDEQVLQRYDQTYEQQYVGEEGQQPINGQFDDPQRYAEQQLYDDQTTYENHTSQNQQIYEGQQQYEGEQYEVQQPATQPFQGEQQYEGHQPETQAFESEAHYEGHQPQTQAYEGEQQYEGHQPQTQAYEGALQYEGHEPETQAFESASRYEGHQPQTQAYEGGQQYEDQQYEQTQIVASEEIYKNDAFNTEQNIEQELDKDDGLPQMQSSELQSPVKEI